MGRMPLGIAGAAALIGSVERPIRRASVARATNLASIARAIAPQNMETMMSRDDARRRLGAYSDRDVELDAKELEIAELRAQLEEARTALMESRHRRPRTTRLDIRQHTFWQDAWILVFVLVGGLIVSKGRLLW